jgi:hypothetical protein
LADLEQRGPVPAGHRDRIVLQDLRLAGQPIPDVEVRVGRAATLLHVDGILGFDFFRMFPEIRFDTRTFVMTLRLDPS